MQTKKELKRQLLKELAAVRARRNEVVANGNPDTLYSLRDEEQYLLEQYFRLNPDLYEGNGYLLGYPFQETESEVEEITPADDKGAEFPRKTHKLKIKLVIYKGKAFDVDITEGDSFLTVECNGNKAYVGVYSNTDKSEPYCYSIVNSTEDGLLKFPAKLCATIDEAILHCCEHLHKKDSIEKSEPKDVQEACKQVAEWYQELDYAILAIE